MNLTGSQRSGIGPAGEPGKGGIMENVYTCTCGNQTWIVLDNAVRCTACNAVFPIRNTPVTEFNHELLTEIEEMEEA